METIVERGYADHGEHAANILQVLYDNVIIDGRQDVSIILATVKHYYELRGSGMSRNATIDALFAETTRQVIADADNVEEIAY